MKKQFDFLSMFGEEPPKQETDAEKIARIEKALEEKDNAIKERDAKISDLEKKVNSMRIDSIVQKVDPKVVKEEPVEFDFDL